MNATRTWTPLTRVGGVEQKVDSAPLRWKTPSQVVVIGDDTSPNGGNWSYEGLAAMWGVMALCRDHVFQITTLDLTRVTAWWREYMQTNPLERMRAALTGGGIAPPPKGERLFHWTEDRWPLPNVWLIVSVSTQADVDEQGYLLAAFPTAVRGLRVTAPAGELDIEALLYVPARCPRCNYKGRAGFISRCPTCKGDLEILKPMDWIIADYDGANRERLRHIRDQAMEARVPFALTSSQVSSPRLDGELHDGRPGDHA